MLSPQPPCLAKVVNVREEHGGGRALIHYMMKWCLPVLSALVQPAAAGDAPTVDPSWLAEHVARLQTRVDELAGTTDLLDTLHFGWFDRPYARATLAVLVKTTATLQREMRLRERGNGAISDTQVRRMTAWVDDAIERVTVSTPSPDFRPQRLPVTTAALLRGEGIPPLFGIVDQSTATRRDGVFGDLDLMAALGMRVYGLRLTGANDAIGTASDILVQRAHSLGIAVVAIETTHASPTGPAPSLAAEAPSTSILSVRPVALRRLLALRAESVAKEPITLTAVDPVDRESSGGFIARRALARGSLGRAGFVVDGWRSPRWKVGPEHEAAATVAAMWASALDGQQLGVLRGWRDLRDGSGSPYVSMFLEPAMMETISHAALDILRLESYVSAFRASPGLAITVGPEAGSDRDENAWAPWVQEVWETLVDAQIRFDVVGATASDASLRERYAVVFPLRRDEAGDIPSVLQRLERALADTPDHVSRVTACEADGTPARDLLVRQARMPNGDRAVALVNLSPTPRRLRLRGDGVGRTVLDVLSDTRISRPAAEIRLDSFQVRLLCAAP